MARLRMQTGLVINPQGGLPGTADSTSIPKAVCRERLRFAYRSPQGHHRERLVSAEDAIGGLPCNGGHDTPCRAGKFSVLLLCCGW